MIAVALIVLGILSLWLGITQLRDRRMGQNDFAANDLTDLHPLWGKVFTLQRFSARIDIWMFLILGPVMVGFGLAILLGGIGT